MQIPADLRYTEEHEWLRVEGNVVTIGITDFAQSELGDVVFLELPKVDDQVRAGSECGTIEAVKTVAQLFAPVTGRIVEINTELEGDAGLVNRDPYGDGWMMKIEMSDPGELEIMLTGDAYRSKVA